jgi:putative inorganic carbon (hco3(-)) transporter
MGAMKTHATSFGAGVDLGPTVTGQRPRSISDLKTLGLAFGALLCFMTIYFARPEDWIPGVHLVPVAKITGALLILAFLLSMGKAQGSVPPEVIYLTLLVVQMFLTVPMSTVWRGGAFWTTLNFSKVAPVVFVMVWVLSTLPRLRLLILLQTVCVTIISAVTVWKGQTLQGRMEGVLNGNYANPNDLACQIVICVPFCVVFLLRARNFAAKLAWGFAILLLTYALVVTGSRAGFLAYALVMGVCIWEFAIRGRYRFLLVFVLIGMFFLPIFGGKLVDRLRSTTNGDRDSSAFDNAQQRKQLLWKSLDVTIHNPIFGVGPGNFTVVSGNWLVTHNSYTQVSAEAGLPALFLYLLILWRANRNVQTVKKYRGIDREYILWAKALRASLLGFMVASFFASVAFEYFPYFLTGYATALFLIARKQRTQSSKTAAVQQNPGAPEETYEQGPGIEPAFYPG